MINEFAFKGPFLKLGQNIGLLVGAVVWGVGSDIWGRRYFSPLKISRHEDSNPLGCPLTLRCSSPAFLPYLLGLRQTQLRYASSRRRGVLEWVVTFPSILLSF